MLVIYVSIWSQLAHEHIEPPIQQSSWMIPWSMEKAATSSYLCPKEVPTADNIGRYRSIMINLSNSQSWRYLESKD